MIKKLITKLPYVLPFLVFALGLTAVSAATLQGFQGGTGYATTSVSNVGNFLRVTSTSPLAYDFAAGSGITTTTGNWAGTWQTKNSYDFMTSSSLTAGSNIVVTGGNTVAVTSTPTFPKLYISNYGNVSGIAGITIDDLANSGSFLDMASSTGNVELSSKGVLQILSGNALYLASYATTTIYLQSGSTAHAILDTSPLASDQTFSFPNKTGTFAMTSDIVTTTIGGVASTTFTLTASSSIGISTTTGGNINFGAKNYPIQFIIENPTASENDDLLNFRTTSTISSCNAVNKSVGDTVTFGLGYSTSRATATSSLTQVVNATTTTVTATTTPVALTLNNITPGLLNPFIFYTTAASSSQFTLTCYYSEK